MTDEEKVERGQAASALLHSSVLDAAIKELANDIQSAFFTTQPGQTDEREQAYFTNLALNGLLQTLQSWVNEKVEAEQRAEQDQENFHNE